jgi:transposase
MAFLRKWEKGGSTTFALVEGHRVKRGKDKGKPRQHILEYIGNLQALSSWVVGRRDAVNLETISIKSVVKYGDVYATLTIAKILEIYDALFPYVRNHEYLKMLLAILINKNIEPKSKLALRDWLEDTALPALLHLDLDKVYPTALYRAMDRLHEKDFNPILRILAIRVKELFGIDIERALLDGTEVFTEGRKCTLFLRDFNTKGVKRPQINIALATAVGSNVPLHLTIEPGKTRFKTMYTEVARELRKEYGASVTETIVDNGFLTADNLRFARGRVHVTSRLAHNSVVARHVVDLVGDGYDEVALANNKTRRISRLVTWDELEPTFADEREREEYKAIFSGFRFIAYESCQQTDEGGARLKKRIEDAEGKLKGLKESCLAAKRGKRERTVWKEALKASEGIELFVRFEVKTDEARKRALLDYEVRWDRFNEKEVYHLYVVLATSDPGKTNLDLMNTYNQHYDVEAAFRTLKSDIEVEPIRHWTDERVKAEVFLCTLALTIHSTLILLARSKGVHLSHGKIMRKLGRIQSVAISDGKTVRSKLSEPEEETALLTKLTS